MRLNPFTWFASPNPSALPSTALAEYRPEFRAIGASGTQLFSGQIYEEYRADLTGTQKYKVYSQMRSDGQISAILSVIELPIRAADWSCHIVGEQNAQAETIKAFVEDCIWNMPGQTWDDFIREALSYIWRGVMLVEKVYYLRPDGKIGWQSFSPRLPNTIDLWTPDENGNLLEVHQNTYGDNARNVTIPASKLLRFTYRQEGSNFEGRSLLRDVYKHWWYKDTLYKLDAINTERMGGIPFARMKSSAPKAVVDTVKDIVKAFRANEEAGFVLPSDFVDEFKLISNRPPSSLDQIQHHDAAIAKAALASFLTSGEKTVGSFALAQNQTDFFLMSLDAIAEHLRSVIQRDAITEGVKLNFGDSAPVPELRYKLPTVDPKILAETLNVLGTPGFLRPDDAIEAQIREMLDLPPIPEGRPPVVPASPVNVPATQSERVGAFRGRQGDIRLAEFVGDPNPPGAKPWREFSERETALGLDALNQYWDGVVESLAGQADDVLDKVVERMLEDLKSRLRQGDIGAVIELPVAYRQELRRVFQASYEEAMDWARAHISNVLNLDMPEVKAAVKSFLRATTNNAVDRLLDNLRQEVIRKAAHDTEYQAEVVAGRIGATTVARVVAEARANAEGIRATQLLATSQVVIGEGIHAGWSAVANDPKVVRAIRSAVLDKSVCPNCRALDGYTVVAPGGAKAPDAGFAEYSPPSRCEGGSRCRCTWVFVLDTDTAIPDATAKAPVMNPTRM